MEYKVMYKRENLLKIKVPMRETFRTREGAQKRFEDLREDDKVSELQYQEQVVMDI